MQAPPAKNTLDRADLFSGLPGQWGPADLFVLFDQTRCSCFSELPGSTTILVGLEGLVPGENTLQEGDYLVERGIFGFAKIEYQDTDLHGSTIPLLPRLDLVLMSNISGEDESVPGSM